MSGVLVMGIDPGLTGGIAIISGEEILLEPMPIRGNEIDTVKLKEFIRQFQHEIRVAAIEKVGAMPGQGVVSMFSFGRVYGIAEGVVVACDVQLVHVRPQEWMKQMHAGIPSELNAKEKSRYQFNQLFPHVDARRTSRSTKDHSGLIDAALIATYARRFL